MIPAILSVKVNSLVLKKGETEIIIEVGVTDPIGDRCSSCWGYCT